MFQPSEFRIQISEPPSSVLNLRPQNKIFTNQSTIHPSFPAYQVSPEMENYQIYFPAAAAACSSSTTTSSAASLETVTNPHRRHHQFESLTADNHINNRASSSSGFLGLQSDMEGSNINKNPAATPDSCLNGNNINSSCGLLGTNINSTKNSKGDKKAKKPRYAFQTKSQVDILDDGYRWRKYGQKAVKNNRFPRSYYRCTHQGCNVKKQVQRLSRDEGVVVTTYEGMHSHPIEKSTDNFEHILSQMQIYTSSSSCCY